MTKPPPARAGDPASARQRVKDSKSPTTGGHAATESSVVQLLAEDISVATRTVVTGTVRVQTHTRTRMHTVDEPTARDDVEVSRVPIGCYVDAIPPVREDGDVTIMSVVEEVVVVERRLLLREEVHVRRVRTIGRHTETVQLRDQEATVTRTPAPPSSPFGEESPSPLKPGETDA